MPDPVLGSGVKISHLVWVLGTEFGSYTRAELAPDD